MGNSDINSDGDGDPGADRLTVYYNGDCPVCSAEIRHYQAIDAARGDGTSGLCWVDLGTDQHAPRAAGIDPADARRRLTAVRGDGTVIRGVDSFIAIWRRLPGWGWLASLLRVPPLRWIADGLYERVAVPVLAWMNARRARRQAQDTAPG